MKIVSTSHGGPRGESVAVFITPDEIGPLIARLRRCRDAVKHTPEWEFTRHLQIDDAVGLDVLADALQDVHCNLSEFEEISV